jgi:hypothetical protein
MMQGATTTEPWRALIEHLLQAEHTRRGDALRELSDDRGHVPGAS